MTVSRPASPHRRAELLLAVVGHLQEHGVADFTLESLATTVGVSKRMLLYYFGDRSTLLTEALTAARPDVSAMFGDVRDARTLRAATQDLWEAITTGPQGRSVRMLLQTLALATTDPDDYGAYARSSVEVVLAPVTAAFERAGWPADVAAQRATLVVSGLRGLCQDLLVTSDRDRVDSAAAHLLDLITS